MPFFGSLSSFFGRLLIVAAVVVAVLSEISTLAGAGISGYFDGSVKFDNPGGVAMDSIGNLYVSDSNQLIRKITPAGLVTTFLNGSLTNPSFGQSIGMVFDSVGNLYISDNHRIRKITPAGVVTNFAGSGTAGYFDGTGDGASFYSPDGLAIDTAGNLYVADRWNLRIRKVTPEGVVTTFAGNATAQLLNGTGTNASFNYPWGLVIDSDGNLYVGDSNNHCIRKITPAGVVTTLAGDGSSGTADGTGTNARFWNPYGLAIDSARNLYVWDNYWSRIRKVTSAGVVTTFAGSTQGFLNGQGTNALFNSDWGGLALDSLGNLYIADRNNHCIRKITPAGVVTTLAGTGVLGFTNSIQNGAVSGALLNFPRAVAVDSSSTMYVADTTNHRIRKITSTGVVTTLAGSGTATFADGSGTNASFNSPQGIAVDSTGNVYVGDTLNNRVRAITPEGIVTTIGGTGLTTPFADGTVSNATFNNPYGVAVDTSGNVYVIDKLNYRVRKITTREVVSTLATGLTSPYGGVLDSVGNLYIADTNANRIRRITSVGTVTNIAGNGTLGSTNGTGTNTSFRNPQDLTIDVAGNLYVVDTGSHLIRMITSTAVVTTLAGSGTAGFADGTGTGASFNTPQGITIDSDGALYVGDTNNNRIRKIALDYVSTFAGSRTDQFADGTGAGASFSSPRGVVFDSNGNLFVSDRGNNRIRRITPAGLVTTLVGNGTVGNNNGTGTNATLGFPSGITIDSVGNLYVSNPQFANIRKITPEGVVTTLAGSGTGGFADGTGTNASFNEPVGIAVDSVGNVYVADAFNHRIRKISPAGVVTTFAGSGTGQGTPTGAFADGTGTGASFSYPFGIVFDSTGNLYLSENGNHRIRRITPAGVVTTFAGGVDGYLDGTGTNARLSSPQGITIDSSGNIYVSSGRRIRKITPDAVVTTLTGTGSSTPFINGPALNATLNFPQGLAIDSIGSIYISDETNHCIRKLVLGGNVVTTFAGQTTAGSTNGTGTNASFNNLNKLAFDSSRNLYVSDRLNNLIRRITPAGVVTTLAGSGTPAFNNGTGTNASFQYPVSITTDSSGNVYVGDGNNFRIRRITPDGVVTTFAGTGNITFADGEALTTATFNGTTGLVFNSSGNLLVSDANNGRIRRIIQRGLVSTLAGDGTAQYIEGLGTAARFLDPFGITINSTGTTLYLTDTHYIRSITTSTGQTAFLAGNALSGSTNANASAARFLNPRGITINSAGTSVFVADTGNHIIRRVTTDFGTATKYSGFGGAGFRETPVANVQYNTPSGIAINSAGLVYVADTNNNRVRTIASGADNTGVVTTVIGTSTAGYTDGGGWFNTPFGVATDWNGTVYVADTINNRIRKISPLGVVTTFAGNGLALTLDATGTTANFNQPRGLSLGSDGTVYVADTTNNMIRRITDAGVVTNMAGGGTTGISGSTNGTGTNALFNSPNAVTVDSTNIVYVADTGNHCIRRITQVRVVTTFVGNTQGFQDGVGTNARFDTPRGIVADSYGNLYVADTNNHRIRRITSDGTVTTLAGSTAGYADGTGTNARFNFPTHISIDALGTLYVADQTNHRIRTIQASTGVVTTLAGDGTAGFTPSRFNSPFGITVERFRNAYVADTNNHSIRKIPNVYTVPENNGVVTTVAGDGIDGFIDANGIGARFSNPLGITVDSVENVYVSDTANHLIRKITPGGVVTTFVGNRTAASTDGTGTNASINTPQGIAIDSEGNIYVGERQGYRIRKITAGGVVTTFAGTTFGYLDGTGVAARFNDPRGIAVDSAKNVYVADVQNHRIRKITSAGVVTTLAGRTTAGYLDGTGTNAQFNFPYGVGVDSVGNVYVADYNNLSIRKITPAGVVTTFVGNGTVGFLDGTGTNARFNYPSGLEVDSADNIYVADTGNQRIRRITPAGVVTTFAGSTAGYLDGTGTNAMFSGPNAVTIYSTGTMYVAEGGNDRIRKIGTTVAQVPLNMAVVTTFAGSATAGATNATGTNATFNFPNEVGVDSAGNLYVLENNFNRIRKITPAGVVTTFAGQTTAGYLDGTGTNAQFNFPCGVAVDSGGTVYVADQNNNRIRKITPLGVVTTLAGQTTAGSTDGTGTNATFNKPNGVAVDSSGTVYVADAYNHRIRKITPAGVVTTLAGSTLGSTNGTGTNATFNYPTRLAVDSAGNVYVADQANHRIRKITPAGVVTTLAGSTRGFLDGTGTNTMFDYPSAIAVDSVGNIYVGDYSNNLIRKITSSGVVTTLAGNGLVTPFTNGIGTNTTFNGTLGVAVDSGGIVYVADQTNNRIRKIQ